MINNTPLPFKPFARTIAAGQEDIIYVTGSQVACLECSLTSFELAVDDFGYDYFVRGFDLSLKPGELFKKVRIKNTNGSAMTVTVAIGDGRIVDRRSLFTGNVITKEALNDGISTTADTTIAASNSTTIAASATRKYIDIFNDGTVGQAALRYGDSTNTGASRGMKIPPQQGIRIETTAAIKIYNPDGASQNICITEVTRS